MKSKNRCEDCLKAGKALHGKDKGKPIQLGDSCDEHCGHDESPGFSEEAKGWAFGGKKAKEWADLTKNQGV